MLGLTVKAEWETESRPTDGKVCMECDKLIEGLMIVGYLFVYNNASQVPSDVIPSRMQVCVECRVNMIEGR